MSTQIATLIEDGSSVVTLGEPVRFSWIDFPLGEECVISAFVIGELPEWTGLPVESEALVLVSGPTVRQMAKAVLAAEIVGPEESAAQARALLELPARFSAPVAEGLLYDVTEMGGGPENWAGQRIEVDGSPVGRAPAPTPVGPSFVERVTGTGVAPAPTPVVVGPSWSDDSEPEPLVLDPVMPASLVEAGDALLEAMALFAIEFRRVPALALDEAAVGRFRTFAAYSLADLEGKYSEAGWISDGLLFDSVRILLGKVAE